MTENDLIKLYCKIDDLYYRYIKWNSEKKCMPEYYGTWRSKKTDGCSRRYDIKY